ncbi:MAG: bifunctional phosphopantothenoylcysteine decarboxylase/phosphopantothenate--cysteine ligase CoaBC [Candidatus Hodarchaeota archaeon]
MGIIEIFGTKGTQLKGKRILIGVTGSIAAIEVPHLIREILRYSGNPIVVLSDEATRLVAIDALTWCMDKEPITKISGISEHVKWVSHPDYKVDLCIICPATANTIAKLANGIADGPVTLAAFAIIGAKIPLLIVPAAHTVLLENPISKNNISYLEQLDVKFLSAPEAESKYKFPPLDQLMEIIINLVNPSLPLQGKKILITGGATREYLDDIRFLSNPSTGFSALQVTKALYSLGAEVSLILGEGHTIDLRECAFSAKIVRSTSDMYDAVMEELSNTHYNVLVSVAAVSDYHPQYQAGKIASRQTNLAMDLIPTVKIVEKVRDKFPELFIVGYKAEVGISKEELQKRGEKFLENNNLQMVCANWVGEPTKGFVSKTNEVLVIRPNRPVLHFKGSKTELGYQIAEVIAEEVKKESE